MKSKHQVITINGHSGHGKSTFAKKFIDNSFIEIDLSEDVLDNVLSDYEDLDLDVINKGKPEILFDRLRYADPRVIRLELKKNEEVNYIVAIINDNGKEEEVFLSKVSKKYRKILALVILIRNKKNLFIDNYDYIFVGSNFRKVTEMLIREIKLSKIKVVLTSTDIGIWQMFSLCLPKEMSKTFYTVAFDNNTNTFEHLELDYLKLAYTINLIYNKNMRRLLELEEEDRPLRPSDEKDY